MSTLGMGIAAGVAQGSVQASQVNRALHRHQTDAAADARRVRQRINAHLDALDEGDEANLISQVRIDDQMPDGRRGHDQPLPTPHEAQQERAVEDGGDADISASSDPQTDEKGERLYRHLDVTG